MVFLKFLLITVSITTAIAWIMGRKQLNKIDCPKVISRDEWNATPTTQFSLFEGKPRYVVIHHTINIHNQLCWTKESCKKAMRGIQYYHTHTYYEINNIKWLDIGYNFCIGSDNNVYEGIGWKRIGTHTEDYNNRSIGICMIGNFNSFNYPVQMSQTAKNFLHCSRQEGYLPADYEVIAHWQAVKANCPGKQIYNDMSSWPRFFKNNTYRKTLVYG